MRPGLLAVLHHVLQERSVARAAQRLHVTPSAISNSLARLREIFGDPLLGPERPDARADAARVAAGATMSRRIIQSAGMRGRDSARSVKMTAVLRHATARFHIRGFAVVNCSLARESFGTAPRDNTANGRMVLLARLQLDLSASGI